MSIGVNPNSNNDSYNVSPKRLSEEKPKSYLVDWNKSGNEGILFENYKKIMPSSNNPQEDKEIVPPRIDNVDINIPIPVCEPDKLRVANPIDPAITQNFNCGKLLSIESVESSKIPDIPTKYGSNYDVTTKLFNGTAKDLNRELKGSPLEGKGQMFIDAQEKYGINALFLMSICKTESGYGAAPAREKNGTVHKYNIAGLKTGSRTPGKIFQDNDSYESCIDSLCRNLHKHYLDVGKKNLASIQKVYCPGNQKWLTDVMKNMNDSSQVIMAPYRI